MPNLNLAIRPTGFGQYIYSGDFNGVASLHGAGYYTLTGDISGTLTLNGYGQATLVGASSNTTYSGAVALSFAANGYGQVSMSGTVGTSNVSATLNLVGTGQSVASGTITASGPTWLFLDQFTTNATAPLTTPRTCEPGPGTGRVIDTENKMSITSNALQFAGGKAAPANGDPGYYSSTTVPRLTGETVYAKLNLANVTSNMQMGWAGSQGSVTNSGLNFTTAGGQLAAFNGGASYRVGPYVISTVYQVAIVLRSAGFFCLIKGGIYTNWTLLYVDNSDATANLYAAISNNTSTFSADDFGYFQLGGVWATDNGLAQLVQASPAANYQGDAGSADSCIEVTFQAATGVSKDLMFRWVDDNNCWIARQNQAGSTWQLIEKNAGVETVRATQAQTWTNGTSYRFFISMEGQSIRALESGNSVPVTYATASFNQTATGVKVNAAATNLIVWPRFVPTAGLPV